MHTNPGPTPRRPDGQPAWFTPEHNAFLERLLHFPPGAVLDMYQMYLVPAAQRILRENRDVPPPAYEEAIVTGPGGIASSSVNGETPPRRASHARPGNGTGNSQGLRRRDAVRIPERGRVRQRGEELEEGGSAGERRSSAGERRSSARASVAARRPVSAVAGERAQRGRVGDARNDGSVSSRTRSRSVRRGGMASKFSEGL